MELPDWPRAHGAQLFSASIRRSAEDFFVAEELGFELSGDGEHDYLFVEKTNTNTVWLAKQLAAFAGVAVRDVGYSGLKDRRAVTRQWFSVPRWNQPDWSAFELEDVRILDVQRNARKLRRGAHRGNLFRIVLRNVAKEDAVDGVLKTLNQRIDEITERGVPNYYGEQRFGIQAGNLTLADEWANGKRLKRHQRSLAISTIRSYLFNKQLADRVKKGTWDELCSGELANLDGSNSVFEVSDADCAVNERLAKLDIHPAGELVGEGSSALSTVEQNELAWLHALENARVKPGHRGLRLRVADLESNYDAENLTLTFSLCRGAFATAVLRELMSIRQQDA